MTVQKPQPGSLNTLESSSAANTLTTSAEQIHYTYASCLETCVAPSLYLRTHDLVKAEKEGGIRSLLGH